jgi:hypothetical protein
MRKISGDLPGRQLAFRLIGFGILALGSAGAQAPADTASVAGEWRPAGKLAVGRYAPGAVVLTDGRALVAGGYSFELDRTHRSSELFDPVKGAWTPGPALSQDRNFPLVIPAKAHQWLFVAGFNGEAGTVAACDLLTPSGPTLAAGPRPAEERELAASAILSDGRVLITGGFSTLRRQTLDSAELYDPSTGGFRRLPARLGFARFGHSAVTLPDGRVLIVGGKVLRGNFDVTPAELFDPMTGEFKAADALRVGRDRCTAWVLQFTDSAGAEVMIAGGSAADGGTEPARQTEIYSVREGLFRRGPDLVVDRMAHCATPLGQGRMLLTGGWSGSQRRTTPEAEVWEPREGRFVAAGSQQFGRHDHAAIPLQTGSVLVAGGKEAPARGGVETPREAELWTPRGR